MGFYMIFYLSRLYIMIKAVFNLLWCLNSVISLTKLEPFVVEGEYSNIEDFPHSAYLTSYCERRKIARCGSSVLNQQILITAAHCMPPNACTNKLIKARLGSVNKSNGITITATKYKTHENYSEDELDYDLALVLLDTPINLNSNISRVVLNNVPVFDGQVASVAGWGYAKENKKCPSFLLKHLTQKIITRKECEKILGLLPEGVFCAGDSRNMSYPSGGDSGSALMFERFTQVGLVSYKLTTINRYLIVYTDVGYFFDWIQENAIRLFCKSDDETQDLT